MAVQRRNDELVDILSADFVRNLPTVSLQQLNLYTGLTIGDPRTGTAASYEINMPGGSSTVNSGNGRELIIIAGSSDNVAGKRGGRLYLRPGRPSAPATDYGDLVMADEGGRVGIGSLPLATKLEVFGNGDIVSVRGTGTEARIKFYTTNTSLRASIGFEGSDAMRIKNEDNSRIVMGTMTNPDTFHIQDNGQVGIGGVPSRKLEVFDRMEIRSGVDGSAGTWLSNSSGTERAFVGLAEDDATPLAGIYVNDWRLVADINGNAGVNLLTPAISDAPGLDINGKIMRLRTAKTPASAGAAGNTGEFCWDSSFFYICVGTNSWRRVAHAAW